MGSIYTQQRIVRIDTGQLAAAGCLARVRFCGVPGQPLWPFAAGAVDELRHYERGHMSAPMAADCATAVEQAVTFMFVNCKLAPRRAVRRR